MTPTKAWTLPDGYVVTTYMRILGAVDRAIAIPLVRRVTDWATFTIDTTRIHDRDYMTAWGARARIASSIPGARRLFLALGHGQW